MGYQFLALAGAAGFLCIRWKAPTVEWSRRWVKRWVWTWVGFWVLGALALGSAYVSLLQGLGD